MRRLLRGGLCCWAGFRIVVCAFLVSCCCALFTLCLLSARLYVTPNALRAQTMLADIMSSAHHDYSMLASLKHHVRVRNVAYIYTRRRWVQRGVKLRTTCHSTVPAAVCLWRQEMFCRDCRQREEKGAHSRKGDYQAMCTLSQGPCKALFYIFECLLLYFNYFNSHFHFIKFIYGSPNI